LPTGVVTGSERVWVWVFVRAADDLHGGAEEEGERWGHHVLEGLWGVHGGCVPTPPVPRRNGLPPPRARAARSRPHRHGAVAGGKDSPNQAILQFEKLQNNNDISLAATAACLFAHKRCRLVDQEAVDMLSFSIDSKQS
jgi:hypothetical protein